MTKYYITINIMLLKCRKQKIIQVCVQTHELYVHIYILFAIYKCVNFPIFVVMENLEEQVNIEFNEVYIHFSDIFSMLCKLYSEYFMLGKIIMKMSINYLKQCNFY